MEQGRHRNKYEHKDLQEGNAVPLLSLPCGFFDFCFDCLLSLRMCSARGREVTAQRNAYFAS